MLDDAESEHLAQVRRLVAGYREAAHRALDFARRYREEEGAPGGDRERACIEQAREWRRAAEVAAFALRFVEGLAFFGTGRRTPERRAFDNPIAIACFVDRAPCFPSRM